MQWRWWRRHREWSTKCQSTAPNRLDVIIFFRCEMFGPHCESEFKKPPLWRWMASSKRDRKWMSPSGHFPSDNRCVFASRIGNSHPCFDARQPDETNHSDRLNLSDRTETKPQTNNSKNTSFSPQHIRWLTTCARRRTKRREKYARRQFRAHRNTHHFPFGCSCNDKQA